MAYGVQKHTKMVTSLSVDGGGRTYQGTNASGAGNRECVEHEPSDDCYGPQSMGQPRRASSSRISLPATEKP